MRNQLMEMLKKLEEVNDILLNTTNNKIEIDFNDFEGFNDEWEEIDRDYVNPELVDEVIAFLNNNCIAKNDNFYATYYFNNFEVMVGFTSYDI